MEVAALRSLGADIHCHFLPGIDDGAKDWQESMELIGFLYRSGIRNLVATPHIRADYFYNTEETIAGAWSGIRSKCSLAFPDLKVSLSAEYFGDGHLLGLLEKGEILPLTSNYVLVESSMRVDQPFFVDVVREVISAGYQPVLAHPERYVAWYSNPKRYETLLDLGVIFQVNMLSIGGKYGWEIQKMAEDMIARGWISAVGSDIHHINALKYLEIAFQNAYFEELLASKLLNHRWSEVIRNQPDTPHHEQKGFPPL